MNNQHQPESEQEPVPKLQMPKTGFQMLPFANEGHVLASLEFGPSMVGVLRETGISPNCVKKAKHQEVLTRQVDPHTAVTRLIQQARRATEG